MTRKPHFVPMANSPYTLMPGDVLSITVPKPTTLQVVGAETGEPLDVDAVIDARTREELRKEVNSLRSQLRWYEEREDDLSVRVSHDQLQEIVAGALADALARARGET